jgi:hypothetical protein
LGFQCQGTINLLVREGKVAQNIGDREGSMAKGNRIVATDANGTGGRAVQLRLARGVVENSPAFAVGQADEQPPRADECCGYQAPEHV